jgi:pimeloyl-ACP methyl ester carboxylesterase
MMENKVFFSGSAGAGICGILSAPTRKSGGEAVLLCHGFASSKDSSTNLRLEEFLKARGIHSLRFDFFGHGESGGEFADITVSQAVADIKAAHEYLLRRGYRRFGLVGSSFGGLASILTAPDLAGLGWLALKSPVSDYLSRLFEKEGEWDVTLWKRRGYHSYTDYEGRERRLHYRFYQDASQKSGYDAAPDITVPTLIVHGEEDETVPLSQSIRLAELIADCRLEVMAGADHGYSQPDHFDRMISLLAGFIVKMEDGR